MVVAPRTAPERPDKGPAHVPVPPVRTCIGCRQKASAGELLRVVISHQDATGSSVAVVAGRRGMPGRGAWLHPDQGCAELAHRRRAFGRALRVQTVDTAAVAEYVAAHLSSSSGTPAGDETDMSVR